MLLCSCVRLQVVVLICCEVLQCHIVKCGSVMFLVWQGYVVNSGRAVLCTVAGLCCEQWQGCVVHCGRVM